MKKSCTFLIFILAFLAVTSFTFADVVSSQSARIVSEGEKFQWNLTFENDLQTISEVFTPEGIDLEKKISYEDKTFLTFEVNSDVEEGPYMVGMRGFFRPGYSATYFTSIGVDIPTEKSLEDFKSNVERGFGVVINRTEFLEKNLSRLKVRQTSLKEKIENLTQQLNNSQEKIEKLENRLEQQNQSTEGETGMTGTFLERGSILLGLTILVVLVAYLAYEKFQEKEKGEEIEVEEKPRDFSPE